jgi:hypothetical protein
MTIEVIFMPNITHLNNIFFKNIPIKRIKYYNLSNNSLSISEKLMLFIKQSTNTAHAYLENLPISLKNNNNMFENNIWYFHINPEKSMFNLPYTLGNVICLPISMLSMISCKDLISLLIHERIHILQRYNQNTWNNYINKNTVWKQLNYSYYEKYLDTLVYPNIIIKNPDTINLYSYENNVAYFVLDTNTNKIKLQWFNIKSNKILEKINKSIFHCEHPYEQYAYYYEKKL